MTQSYWPFDGSDTTETQYSQLFRRLQSDGIWGNPGDDTLRIKQGSGMEPVLKAGYAYVRGHMYYNDEDLAIPVSAAESSSRIDRVVLRLNPTANTITPVVIKGTAGSSEAPAITQTDAANYDILLADIAVGESVTNILDGDITDRRSFMGHVFGTWTTATRPGAGAGTVAPRVGQPGYNTTLNRAELWNGAAWVDISPTPSWSAITGKPSTFAPSAHTHTASDLPKLINLNGVSYGTADPSGGSDGDIYFKIV